MHMEAKQMAKYLAGKNHEAINHKRVARLMKFHGLNSRVRPRRYFQRSPAINFRSNKPFEKMVIDMTFIPVVEGWLVLSAIKNFCSHKIVEGVAFRNSATVELAQET